MSICSNDEKIGNVNVNVISHYYNIKKYIKMPIIYFVDQSGGIFVLCSLLFNSSGPSPNFQTAHFCDGPFVVAAFRVNIHFMRA